MGVPCGAVCFGRGLLRDTAYNSLELLRASVEQAEGFAKIKKAAPAGRLETIAPVHSNALTGGLSDPGPSFLCASPSSPVSSVSISPVGRV